MNIKLIFLILGIFSLILFGIGYYQHNKNIETQAKFKEQQLQYQQLVQQWQNEKQLNQQKQVDLIDQQRHNTFNANLPNHALSSEQQLAIQVEQLKQFCNAHKFYTSDIIKSWLNDDEVYPPDLSLATNDDQTHFLEAFMDRLNALSKHSPNDVAQIISEEEFIENEFNQCMSIKPKAKLTSPQ